jgi:hypothetical protein
MGLESAPGVVTAFHCIVVPIQFLGSQRFAGLESPPQLLDLWQ